MSLKHANELLKDQHVRNTLTPELCKFIENNVKKIIELEEVFGKEAEKIEKELIEMAKVDSGGVLSKYQNEYAKILA